MPIPSAKTIALLCGIAVTTFSSTAGAQVEGPRDITVVARAQVKGHNQAPALQPSAVKVQLDGHPVPVTSVRPLLGDPQHPVEIALLIDDGLRGMFDTNLPEIQKFVRTTAGPSTYISVGYMINGMVRFSTPFTNDPDVLAKSVHIPLQMRGVEGSAYFCLSWLTKNWPTQSGNPRVVLMITNGIDYYNGSVSPLNQDSPYVQATIDDAQRARIPVYSIYYSGRAVSGTYSSMSGQSYLTNLADSTGGEEYNNGTITPPSLMPFLNQFRTALDNSYAVTFQAVGKRLERLKISSDSGVKLRAPNAVDPSKL